MGHNGLWHKGNGLWVTRDEKDRSGRYSGNRPNLYDLSIRVPLIIRWPGQVESGTDVKETVSHIDLYPTLLEMAGIARPYDLFLSGNSIVPLLKGSDIPSWDNIVFAQFLHLRCIQTPQLKYVHDFSEGRHEFYSLANDPDEKFNLIDSENFQTITFIEEFKGLLIAKLKEINDPILTH